MRSSSGSIAAVLLLVSTITGAPQAASTSTSTNQIDWSPAAIVEANTLQKDGQRPFHVKISFQVFDLQGKPADQGTLEYWWAGPDGTYLDITSPALGTLHFLQTEAASPADTAREMYLLQELLDDLKRPGAAIASPNIKLATEDKTIAGVSLKCMHPVPPDSKYKAQQVDVCADTATGSIRFINSIQNQTVRNRTGRFGSSLVAQEITVLWGGRQAITGHVERLNSFNPSGSEVALIKTTVQAGDPSLDQHQVRIAGGVIAGNKVSGPQPIYPVAAREGRIQGTVLLTALITKEGKIGRLIPMASPDPLLTLAATDAVRKWIYTPYLLNGKPTDITTTITVNFALNSR